MTTSHSDQKHRTLNYVEVLYFDKGKFKSRKHAYYPVEESEKIFQRTINKMTEDKIESMVCLRTETHELIKSFVKS